MESKLRQQVIDEAQRLIDHYRSRLWSVTDSDYAHWTLKLDTFMFCTTDWFAYSGNWPLSPLQLHASPRNIPYEDTLRPDGPDLIGRTKLFDHVRGYVDPRASGPALLAGIVAFPYSHLRLDRPEVAEFCRAYGVRVIPDLIPSYYGHGTVPYLVVRDPQVEPRRASRLRLVQ